MHGRKLTGMALAALFAFTTACHDDATGPIIGSEELSQQEAADVAEVAADQIDLLLDEETAANPSIFASGEGLSFSAVPVTTNFSWTRERECRDGGLVSASGSGTHVADRDTGELTIDFTANKTITDCARVTDGGVTVTLNGTGTLVGHRYKVNGQFSGIQTNSATGSFSWVTSDGREGACEFDINVEWDPASHTKTITGSVCGRDIDRTVTRDGSAGNDGRGA